MGIARVPSSEPCRVPVAVVLSRLRERPFDIRSALEGSVLTLSVEVTDHQSAGHSIVFSPDGHMSVFPSDRELPAGFTPHVRVRGTADQVLRFVLGETDAFTAVFDDVLHLALKPSELVPQFPQLMRLVREEAWGLLDADRIGE